MRTYDHIKEFSSTKKTVVTIGTFDGVHRGHQKILDRVASIAVNHDLESALLTFFPHPRMVLQQDLNIKLINTIDEREQLVASRGIQHIVTHPFSKEFSRTTAEEFVKEFLVDGLNAHTVVIGYDHRFGRNRSADISDLREMGSQYGFEVVEISKKEVDEVAVSSTKIRNALQEGKLEIANTYLNYDFFVSGKVTSGRQLGRKLGYPTANLDVNETYKLLPSHGVYITSTLLDGKKQYGITNIGTNPTVTDDGQVTIETFFLDLDRDLYQQQFQLSFHQKIRDEERFDTFGELTAAMKKDEQQAREYIQRLG